jgi:hypothetical protein
VRLVVLTVAAGSYLEVVMFRFTRQARGLLILITVAAIVVAACGSSAKAPTGSSGAGASQATAKPTLSGGGGGGGGGGDLSGAAANLDNITSYKFSMTLAGGQWGSMLGMLGGGASETGNAPFTITGTIVTKPDKAADISLAGLRMIEIGGMDYIDLGTGQFMSTPQSGSSLADSFAPSEMFSSMVGSVSTGFNKVGTEQKNGVAADHYQGTDAAFAGLDTLSGVQNATWTADVWIATEGGYPVSMAVIGTVNGEMVYEILFDVTNVNDPGNKIEVPSNVMTLPS